MLVLTEDLFIAEGLVKKCYSHPSNINLCVKLCKPENKATKQLKKELNYLNKIQKKDCGNLSFPFFSKFLGTVKTNLGEGYLYDLVFDETTGNNSKTLEFYLNNKNSNDFDTELKKAIDTLKNQMISNKVFANDLIARNICCKILRDNTLQLVIVDGMGHRDFFPIAEYLPYFAKKKVERRLSKSDFYHLT